MSTDGSDETTARLKHLGGVEILVLVLALGTGGLAAAYAIAMAVGAHAAGLEPPLMLLELGGILALGEGGALVVGVVLFGLAGLRYWDNGFRLDARVVAMPLAIAVIVWSVKYAHEAREAGAARHAREMAEAAEQGGKQRLREIAFACHGFCGYAEDSGPLVWLVGQADSVADYNAIGLMLNQRADRSARSAPSASRTSTKPRNHVLRRSSETGAPSAAFGKGSRSKRGARPAESSATRTRPWYNASGRSSAARAGKMLASAVMIVRPCPHPCAR